MKRKLIVAIVVIIAVCTGIYFWTEWEKARFDASLAKPPAEEEQVADDVTEDTAGGHWHGDEWHAEPHVADEAPPVQPVTEPAAEVTEDTEAARQRIEALELPPIPPSELELEHEAIQADLNALIEQRGTLSRAKFQKGINDILDRQQAWNKKFSERPEEAAASIREREAERKPVAVGDR